MSCRSPPGSCVARIVAEEGLGLAWVQAGFGQLSGDRGTEGLEAAVIHAGRGTHPMESATEVALVDRAPAAGGEGQPVGVVEGVGCPLLLAVAPRFEFGGDLGPQRDGAT
jgi:hypothetical protein